MSEAALIGLTFRTIEFLAKLAKAQQTGGISDAEVQQLKAENDALLRQMIVDNDELDKP